VSALGGDEGSGSPDSTAPAIAPRPWGPKCTAPTVPFQPQHCLVCHGAKLFVTRSSLAVHLRKRHQQFLSKRGWCAPVPPVEGQGMRGGTPHAAPQAEPRPLLPRVVRPLLSLAVTMPPQPAAAPPVPRPLLPQRRWPHCCVPPSVRSFPRQRRPHRHAPPLVTHHARFFQWCQSHRRLLMFRQCVHHPCHCSASAFRPALAFCHRTAPVDGQLPMLRPFPCSWGPGLCCPSLPG